MSEDEPPLDEIAQAVLEAASEVGVGVVVRFDQGAALDGYVNEAALSLTQRSAGELLAGDLHDLFAPDDAQQVRVTRESVAPGAPSRSLEADLLQAEAKRVSVHLSTSAIDVGGAPARVDLFYDIGERRRVQRELSRAETRFQRIIDGAPVAIAIARAERLIYANPALVRLLRYDTAEELVALSPAVHVHPDDVRSVIDALRARAEAGDAQASVEVRGRRRDGTRVALEVMAMPTIWDHEQAILMFVHDPTERRLVLQRIADADRLAAVGTLALGVAHEINNPLAYVLLNLQFMLRELTRIERHPDQIAGVLERMNEAQHGTRRVRDIVRGLRDLAPDSRDEDAVVDVLEPARTALRVALASTGSCARITLDRVSPARVRGSALRLEQVLVNLLVNAAHAVAERADGEIALRIAPWDPGRVAIEVRDNGAGIEPDLRKRVFDPFFTTKPVGVGTGLGLPICHGIVVAMGGELSFDSEVGRGTTFRVVLPEVEAEVTPTGGGPASALGPRVIVAVSDVDTGLLIAHALGPQADVRALGGARAALAEVCLDDTIAAVLCELEQPGFGGIELCEELARARSGAERKLLFLVASEPGPRAAAFLARVPNPRFQRPFDLEALCRRVLEHARGTPGP